ncbi:MAG: response regulator transcription factor [Clostridiales bacterium]|jgi:DNA-binding response OmpR family regulator|nr:response regulator transcription factor [Clostridiales bacterium]
MSHILIVEDESKISRFVSLELQHEGYDTTVIADGREALDAALEHEYDLIILDVMLPSLNGIEILRRLRQSKDTPVIILTARDQVVDKVTGLDIGADDYMTKPFAIEELLARIRVSLKKMKMVHTIGKLTVDIDSHIATYDGDPIELTKKEFELLVYLIENRNVVISREKALDVVWGYDFVGNTNVVDVYIRYLRSKIDDAFGIKLIETVRGFGYVIRHKKTGQARPL